MPLLVWFVLMEIPVFFFQATSAVLMRKNPGDFPLQRLWALEFPLVALGGVGLPLWALVRLLQLAA